MSNVWDRFDDIASPDEVAEAKGKFEPFEEGNYTVTLEAIGAVEAQDGSPKIEGKFRTDDNRVLFYNQLLQNANYPDMTAANISKAVTFIGGLLDDNFEFKGLCDLEKKINKCPIGDKFVVKVVYSKKNLAEKKFPELRFVSKAEDSPVSEGDGFMNIPDGIDSDLPFN